VSIIERFDFLFLANKAFTVRKKKADEEKRKNAPRKRVGEQESKEEEKKDVMIELCEIIMHDIKEFKVSTYIHFQKH